MNVFLDNTRIEAQARSFADALAAGQSRAAANCRILVEAMIDGRPADDSDIAGADQPLDAKEIRFLSADPGQLASDSITDVATLLDAARDSHQQAAEMLQTGQLRPAMEAITISLTIWDNVQQVIGQSAELLGLKLDDIALPDSAPIGTAVAGLADDLRELKRTVVDQDWAALADLLEVDMQAHADAFGTILPALASHVLEGRD